MQPKWLEDFAARSNSTPEQWDAIAAELPIAEEEQRRRYLLRCFQKIRWYWLTRDLDAQVANPADARAALAKVTQQAHRLRAAIDALPPAALLGLSSVANRNPTQNWEEFIGDTAETITRLAADAETAKADYAKNKSGPPAPDALDWLVGEIAVLWRQRIHRPFNRSEKRGGAYEFVRALIALVDPEVGPGTLDAAMRRRRVTWRN